MSILFLLKSSLRHLIDFYRHSLDMSDTLEAVIGGELSCYFGTVLKTSCSPPSDCAAMFVVHNIQIVTMGVV